ncbi:hypothetical protein [Arthrobacter sp. Br18]|uniref:DUF7793 family protein n=1 Tax=Arthrobacter sp. Br18 TaxID=1312954 RepID=UPI0004B62C4F|nr:hypothetical protein [Arthrobacter sp. Br18]
MPKEAPPFSVQLDEGFLRLRWTPGTAITHAVGVAAASALADLHGPSALPLLVTMSGIRMVTPEAREGMVNYRKFPRVALIGGDPVDEVMAAFSHRSPMAIRYFTSEPDGLHWLLS